jgi:hypothetical protein
MKPEELIGIVNNSLSFPVVLAEMKCMGLSIVAGQLAAVLLFGGRF